MASGGWLLSGAADVRSRVVASHANHEGFLLGTAFTFDDVDGTRQLLEATTTSPEPQRATICRLHISKRAEMLSDLANGTLLKLPRVRCHRTGPRFSRAHLGRESLGCAWCLCRQDPR